jgi:transcription elongation GreA/GreB family factor
MASAKPQLKAELILHLEAELEKARASHAAAAAAATDDEARPENDKDTRGLEQSYLARGHAMRVAELETAIVELNVFEARAYSDDDEIAIGALVTVTDQDEDARQIWIVPHGGGIGLGKGVTAVAPTSPLGGKLVGKTVDDEIEMVRAGAKRTLTITAIR